MPFISATWKQIENEAGYPYFINEETKEGQFDHPNFNEMMVPLDQYKTIKYATYRMAFKVCELQEQLKVPPVKISMGVLARHCLSISESSVTLEPSELEAVLTDIYFASEKEGLFTGNLNNTVQMILNLLLNTYDSARNTPIKVQSAKCLLIILSSDDWSCKKRELLRLCSDHNGCVSPRRLGCVLEAAAQFAVSLGERTLGPQLVTHELHVCFQKTPGMLGLSEYAVQQWLDSEPTPVLLGWLPVVDRVRGNRKKEPTQVNWNRNCSACNTNMQFTLKFICTKCNIYLCEKCYLYEDNRLAEGIQGHERTHLVNEIVGDEPTQKTSKVNIRSLKRFFTCTKSKKKQKKMAARDVAAVCKDCDKENDRKPGIFTSTVGKASGSKNRNLSVILNDIIGNLEVQNRALKELSSQLSKSDGKSEVDSAVKMQVEAQWAQIATQISRLKLLQDTLSTSTETLQAAKKVESERLQAFEMFSPIPAVDEVKSKVTCKPRVLSVDSGNFSSGDGHLMSSGDNFKPVVNSQVCSESISAVSVGDISTWLGSGGESSAHTSEVCNEAKLASNCLAACELKYAADVKCLEASNDKVREANADLDSALERLQRILALNFTLDESNFDNTQLKERASEMEDLLGSLIRGVEQRRTHTAAV